MIKMNIFRFSFNIQLAATFIVLFAINVTVLPGYGTDIQSKVKEEYYRQFPELKQKNNPDIINSKDTYIELKKQEFQSEFVSYLNTNQERSNTTVASFLSKVINEQKNQKYDDTYQSVYQKKLDVASICFFAAVLKSASPIALYKEQFDLNIAGYEKFYGGGYPGYKETVKDYPFIYLSLACKDNATKKSLQEILYDANLSDDCKVYAFTTLFVIDEELAKSAVSVVMDDLNEESRIIITNFLQNPNTETPWDLRAYRPIPERFKKRIEEAAQKRFNR